MTMTTGTFQTAPIRSDFQLNGVSITAPTTVQWVFPKSWEIDGSGFERLEPFGSCQITWNYMDFASFTTLRETWGLISGTAQIKLPNIYGFARTWVNFDDVIVDMPRPENPFFEGNHSNVKMTVRKVRINALVATP